MEPFKAIVKQSTVYVCTYICTYVNNSIDNIFKLVFSGQTN